MRSDVVVLVAAVGVTVVATITGVEHVATAGAWFSAAWLARTLLGEARKGRAVEVEVERRIEEHLVVAATRSAYPVRHYAPARRAACRAYPPRRRLVRK